MRTTKRCLRSRNGLQQNAHFILQSLKPMFEFRISKGSSLKSTTKLFRRSNRRMLSTMKRNVHWLNTTIRTDCTLQTWEASMTMVKLQPWCHHSSKRLREQLSSNLLKHSIQSTWQMKSHSQFSLWSKIDLKAGLIILITTLLIPMSSKDLRLCGLNTKIGSCKRNDAMKKLSKL